MEENQNPKKPNPNKYKIYDDIRIELWCENPNCVAMKDVGEEDYRHVMDASEWLEKDHICCECGEETRSLYDNNIDELKKETKIG